MLVGSRPVARDNRRMLDFKSQKTRIFEQAKSLLRNGLTGLLFAAKEAMTVSQEQERTGPTQTSILSARGTTIKFHSDSKQAAQQVGQKPNSSALETQHFSPICINHKYIQDSWRLAPRRVTQNTIQQMTSVLWCQATCSCEQCGLQVRRSETPRW